MRNFAFQPLNLYAVSIEDGTKKLIKTNLYNSSGDLVKLHTPYKISHNINMRAQENGHFASITLSPNKDKPGKWYYQKGATYDNADNEKQEAQSSTTDMPRHQFIGNKIVVWTNCNITYFYQYEDPSEAEETFIISCQQIINIEDTASIVFGSSTTSDSLRSINHRLMLTQTVLDKYSNKITLKIPQIHTSSKAAYVQQLHPQTVQYSWYERKDLDGKFILLENSNNYEITIDNAHLKNNCSYQCRIQLDDFIFYSNVLTFYYLPSQMSFVSDTKVKLILDKITDYSPYIFKWYQPNSTTSDDWYYDTSSSKIKTIDGASIMKTNGTADLSKLEQEIKKGKSNRYKYVISSKNDPYVFIDKLTSSSLYIVQQPPQYFTLWSDTTGTISVEANEGATPSYRWFFKQSGSNKWNETTMTGFNTKALTINSGKREQRNGYQYRCKLTSDSLTIYSEPTTLQILSIVSRPESCTCSPSDNATFSVTTKYKAYKYIWQCRVSDLAEWITIKEEDNATNDPDQPNNFCSTLTIPAKDYENYSFRCVINDDAEHEQATNTVTLSLYKNISIITQPQNAIVETEKTATFTVEVDGDVESYNWYQYHEDGDIQIADFSTNILKLNNVDKTKNGCQYYCKIIGKNKDEITTNLVTLTVYEPVEIIEQPASEKIAQVNETIVLSLTATGDVQSYQWQYCAPGTIDWTDIASANTNSLQILANKEYNNFQYRCVITGINDSIISNPTLLTVYAPIEIVQQPQNISTISNQEVTFSVDVTGDVDTYRWQQQSPDTDVWDDIILPSDDMHTSTLTIVATLENNNYKYRCVLTGKMGEVQVTDTAILTLSTPITIISNPENIITVQDEEVTFEVIAEGDIANYQWYQCAHNDVEWLPVSNSNTLTLQAQNNLDKSQYYCIITGVDGTSFAETEPVTLRVLYPTLQAFNDEDNTIQISINTDANDELKYQWEYSTNSTKWYETTLGGYNTNTLTVTEAASSRYGYHYRCIINGTLITSAVTLNFAYDQIIITSQPDSVVEGKVGDTVQISVEAKNVNSYQWQYRRSATGNWTNTSMTGATTDTLSVAVIAARNGYQYRCALKGVDEKLVYTTETTLTVIS